VQGSFDDLFDDLLMSGRMRSIRRDLLHRPIATVMDAAQASRSYLAFMRGEITEAELDEQLGECILEHGMTKEDIEREFPPQPAIPGQSDLSFNRTALIATILWVVTQFEIYRHSHTSQNLVKSMTSMEHEFARTRKMSHYHSLARVAEGRPASAQREYSPFLVYPPHVHPDAGHARHRHQVD
jgi:hypothetical protein